MRGLRGSRLRRAALASTGAVAALVGLGAAPAWAQAGETAANEGVETITVTSRRREEALQDVPLSVTAIGAAELEERGVADLSDLSRLAPNLAFSGGAVGGAGTSGAAQVFVRGVGQDDYLPTSDPGVGIYLDGVYLGRTTGSILQTVDVERVEVLRGPQGTLFGRNTVGGAISITSRAPSDTFEASGALTAGENGLFEARASLSGPLGDRIAGRIAGVRRVQDGLGRSTRAAGEFGNVDRVGVAGALDFELSDRLTVRLSGDYGETDQASPTQVLTFASSPPASAIVGSLNGTAAARGFLPLTPALVAGDRYTSGASTPGYDRSEVGGVALTADFELSEALSLRSITAFRFSDVEFLTDADSSAAPVNEVSVFVDQTQTSQELQLNGSFERVQFTLGGYYFTEEVDFAQRVNLAPGYFDYLVSQRTCSATPPLPGPPSPCFFASRGFISPSAVETDSVAVFGQATIQLTERLSTTLGVRYSEDTKDFQTRSISIVTGLTTLGPLTREGQFDSLTPRVGLEYKLSPTILAFASFASGFKAGTFNGRASAGAGLTEAEPEEADTYEIGVKSDWFDNRLRINATYFTVDYANLQTTVSATDASGGVFTALLNAAAAESSGVELELLARPIPALQVGLNYGYTDAEITESTAGAVAQGIRVGNRLGKTPESTLAAFAQVSFPLLGGEGRARADYSWQSDMFHLTSNHPTTAEDAYGVLNARLSWDAPGRRYGVSVFATNLADETYAVNRSWVGSLGFATANFARPREVGVTLRAAF